MAGLRNRTSPAIRLVIKRLRSGLVAKLTSINDDLAAEGAPYALKTDWVSNGRIDRGGQGERGPKVETPRVVIESGQVQAETGALHGRAEASIPLTLFCYMRTADLNISADSDQTAEASLCDAMDDLMEAIERVVDDARGELQGVGVYTVDVTTQVEQGLYGVSRGEATGMQGRITLVLRQGKEYAL